MVVGFGLPVCVRCALGHAAGVRAQHWTESSPAISPTASVVPGIPVRDGPNTKSPSSLLFNCRMGAQKLDRYQLRQGGVSRSGDCTTASGTLVWDLPNMFKHYCMAMAPKQNKRGRKLKDTSFLYCEFLHLCNITFQKSSPRPEHS